MSVRGQVLAPDETAIPGVNVVVKGTSQGTVTDIDGNYSIGVSSGNDTLIFSFVGYANQVVPINGRSTIDVTLQEDVEELSEVVVVGYGTQRKSDLTGSVAQLDGEELNAVPSQSPLQGLQGKVAGVQVTSSSGAPGAAPSIRIRGTGTLNDASPLFVVDGVLLREAEDINYLNSDDIASMEILKDASATAIYGARGANGVVIITTKQGEEGDARINADVSYGFQTIPNKIDMLNGPQWRALANEIDPSAYPIEDVPNTDWQNLIFDEPAGLLDANLSISGGSDKVRYYVAGGYFNQEGVVPSSDFERISLRLNNTYELSDFFEVGHNISVARTRRNNEPGGIIASAYRARPDIAPYNAEGGFSEVPSLSNPLAAIEYNNSNSTGLSTVGNIFAEVTFLENFRLRSSFGVSADFYKSTNFTPEYFVSSVQQNQLSDLSVRREEDTRWFWESTLNYQKEIGVNRFDGLVGFTLQEERFEFLESRTEGLLRADEALRFIDGGQVDEEQTDGNGNQQAIQSFLFRANYAYDSRYLLTVTGRLDASSVFGENYQYGFFPSVGVGWNIAQEAFLENSNFFTTLKLRGSWGVTGNDRIGAEARFPLINTGLDAVFGPGENLSPGATVGVAANENLRWEETTQYDVGLEIGILDGRLNIEADYYDRTTSDILIPIFVPGYYGNGPFVSVVFNTAEVLNRGFEFNINWREQIGDFSYSIGANGTTVNNELLEIGSESGVNSFITGGSLNNGQLVTRTEVGQPVGSFYGYQIAGVFQNQDEVDTYPAIGGQTIGDFRYVDNNGLNENGELIGEADGNLTEADRNFIGSPIPDFIYGFNFNLGYKGFDLAMDFQGQVGNEIYNGKRAQRFALANYQALWLDRWTGPGTSNSVPRASAGGVNFLPSEFFVEDGSFLRLRTVTLGYDLPAAMAENLSLTQARVYVRGTNVFTITDYSGYTPEIGVGSPTAAGIDLGEYPVTSIYSVGINITL
ncbi:SusC/RagA family TonB-linked outer membrane protein [Catalinimonas alkaloidigena]|uniref:SusC/RagA family TonB-linked outer membrane protein n=1 Tax=Catalinimonas alkaloidigena TaxID=1075417 RepID=UPI002406FD95|nr:TonB-dependent receptor [Catalinimonas alkaloidigena]